MPDIRYFNNGLYQDQTSWSSLRVYDYGEDRVVIWQESGPERAPAARSVVLDKEQLQHLVNTFAGKYAVPVTPKKWEVLRGN